MEVDRSEEQGRRSGQECMPHFLLHVPRLVVEPLLKRKISLTGRPWLSFQRQRSATINLSWIHRRCLNFCILELACLLHNFKKFLHSSGGWGGGSTIDFITHFWYSFFPKLLHLMIIHLDTLPTSPLKLAIMRTLKIIIKLAIASFVLLIARRGKKIIKWLL